jgi:hypothetical protein
MNQPVFATGWFEVQTWTTDEICFAAQVSRRRVQFADEHHYISPDMEDHRRAFSFKDSLRALAIFALTSRGVTVKKAAHIARSIHLPRLWSEPGAILAWTDPRAGIPTLKFFSRTDDIQLIAFLCSMTRPVLVTSLEASIERLKAVKTMSIRERRALLMNQGLSRR